MSNRTVHRYYIVIIGGLESVLDRVYESVFIECVSESVGRVS